MPCASTGWTRTSRTAHFPIRRWRSTSRTACSAMGGDLSHRAAAARLCPGHLPLVQPRRIHPLVVPGPADGVPDRRRSRLAAFSSARSRAATTPYRWIGPSPGSSNNAQRCVFTARAPGSGPKCGPPIFACMNWAMPIPSKSGGEAASSAGCTASPGARFFGESMFSTERDASKIALYWLARQLHAWGYHYLDGQVGSPHLYRMGAIDISRAGFSMPSGKRNRAKCRNRPGISPSTPHRTPRTLKKTAESIHRRPTERGTKPSLMPISFGLRYRQRD